MEQLSSNNFDALFQKAAEDYPLKTDNKNWDIVAAKLKATPLSSSVKNSRKWKYALLLLLVFSAGSIITYHFYNTTLNSNNKISLLQDKSLKPELIVPENKQPSAKNKFDNQPENNTKNTLAQQSKTSLINKSRPSENIVTSKTIAVNNMAAIESIPGSYQYQSSLQPSATANNNNIINNSSNNISAEATIDDKKAVANGTINIGESKNASNSNSKKEQTDNTQSAKSTHLKLSPQEKVFYGELFFAPDFATVKYQNVNKPGYKAGVAIGYRISKRFSAELGLERMHNNFYSDEKYLNKSNLKFKPDTKLQSVNGKSKLTEVPFDIRYNFSKNKEQFFATIGTTVARITHTEKYNYHVTKDGAPKEISRHFGALTGTKFFSDINFSAGYQTPLSRNFSLKAEPYYQVPLKGLGVGSLPVTNFGINIGIIKKLK